MITQYIFLVSDLKSIKKGALIAQACHSAIKAIELFRSNSDTQLYLKSLDTMTTVILKIKKEDILEIKETLSSLDIVEWIEQPENIITCLALRPYNLVDLQDYLSFIKKFSLF